MPMRTALCLSGNMRTYAETYDNLRRNIIEPNKCDVFISTWDVLGNAKHNHADKKEFQEPLDQEHVRLTYGNELKSLKVFNFAKIQPDLPQLFYLGMTSMFWQIYQADLLRQEYERQNNFRYDCVIRARPDHLFHTGFEFSNLDFFNNGICVKNFNEILVDDTFAIGTAWAMQHYSELFLHLEEYFKFKSFLKPHPVTKEVGWPEQVLLMHLQRAKVPMKLIPIEYEIYRGKFVYS